jgi:hypothetical protein
MLFAFFSLTAFKLISLFSVLVVLIKICHGEVLFWSSVCCPWGFLYLNGYNFLVIWEIFWYYFIEYVKYPFVLHLFSFFNAYGSLVWFLLELLSSCIFLSQLLSCFTEIFSAFSLFSILSLSSENLSSTYYSLLEWPSTVIFVWLKGFFISRISVDSFFWGFLYLCSTPLLYSVLLYSCLFYISLFL